MKRFLAILLTVTMSLGLVACSSNSSTESSSKTFSDSSKYKVGICQLGQYESVNSATQGFKDALNEELGVGVVSFHEENGQGDSDKCSTIIEGFVSDNVDLILANTTPVLQAAQAETDEIPILGTSVTEYGVALGIKDFDGLVGSNISGTSDLAPLDQQAAMLKELFPDKKNVGLLYCTEEANSKYQVNTVQKELENLGYTCKLYGFSNSNDLVSVTKIAADGSDVIYIPTDNMVALNAGVVDNICRSAKVPVIGGEEGTCKKCGVATLAIDYYDLGVATGKMAAKILTGESKVEEMKIEYAAKFTKKYNKEICKNLGIEVPNDYVAFEK